MTALAPHHLLPFLDATAALRVKGPPVQHWLRERVLSKANDTCWLCRLPAVGVVPLFSPALGGVKTERNLMAVCVMCRVLFLDRDPLALSWETGQSLAEGHAQQRLDALAGAMQHVVPSTAQRSVATCTGWLSETRWLHPRVPVAVLCADTETWFTPVSATPGMAWAALALAARQRGAVPLKVQPGVFVIPSAEWEPLAWALIERGAILRRVEITGVDQREETRPSDEGKPLGPGAWDRLFHGVQQTTRGREAKARSGFGHRAAAVA